MTQESKESLISFGRSNAISIGTLFTVLSAIFYMNTSWVKATEDIEHIKKHIEDPGLHMPLIKKNELFVPRRELEQTLDGLSRQTKKNYDMLIRIEDRMNKN